MSCWNQNTLIHKFTSRRAYCSSNPSLFYERKFIAADLYFLPLCPFMRILNASDCVWIGVSAHSPSLCMTRPLFSSFFPSAYGASILKCINMLHVHTHKHTHTHRRTHNIHIQAVFSLSFSLYQYHTHRHTLKIHTSIYVQSIQIVRGSHMRCNKGN